MLASNVRCERIRCIGQSGGRRRHAYHARHDDDILQAAKELARPEGKTAGQVISELARRGLTQGSAPTTGFAEETTAPFVLKNGWYVLTNRTGVVVTKELVDRLIEEADLEDAGLTKEDLKKGK